MAWVKDKEGKRYFNLDNVSAMNVREMSTGVWRIGVNVGFSSADESLIDAGPYPSQADAYEAIRKLVQGVNASTIV